MIDETVEEISEMQTHSSSVVAVRAARALEELLDREFANVAEFERDLERNSSVLRRANPSHASLLSTQRRIVDTIENRDADTVEDAKAATAAIIDEVVEELESSKTAAARKVARMISDDDVVLTHDYSTTLLEAFGLAASDGVELDVYATEARPRLQGRRTARKLAEIDGVSVTLIVDDAVGHYLPECDRALIGMDCIVDGTLYNRVGTYPLAATAADTGVPLVVAGSSTKLIDGGFRFENEFRPKGEVILEPVDEFEVENPAYDATPTRLVDSVVTDEGVTEP
jgi:translation initiation factor eIF-2B subunit delta